MSVNFLYFSLFSATKSVDLRTLAASLLILEKLRYSHYLQSA